MSDAALQQFEEARKSQLDRNEARRMWGPINQARGDTLGAGARWPFELTQNAHDPGARSGAEGVNIQVSFDGATLVYQHDGKPFTMQDLAALLSGGSNKDVESVETTGRFGTGFLVTHVLSLQINFIGVLAAEGDFEEVTINLDRAGGEKKIFENTIECYQAIAQAPKLDGIIGRPTAKFTFHTDNPDAARIGVAAFGTIAPYLYGTCEHLGKISIDSSTEWHATEFVPELATTRSFNGVHVREREFAIHARGAPPRRQKVVTVRREPTGLSSLVILTEKDGDSWRVNIPRQDLPRIFCRFPIRNSDFLPINAIIDGRFDLRMERDRVLMKDEDQKQIEEALRLLPTLVQLAVTERWQGAHQLARVGMPEQAFGERLEEPLRSWWRNNLAEVAASLAQMPIVETPTGMVKAVGPAPIASMVMPSFETSSQEDELDFEPIWNIANEVVGLHPPKLDIAPDWIAIANQWTKLGVKVQRMALVELAAKAQQGCDNLGDLKVTVDPLDWLARFLDLVGRVADKHNCSNVLAKLLPNQNRRLKSPDELALDPGLTDEIKDIAADLDYDLRGALLLRDMELRARDPQLVSLSGLIASIITRKTTEEAVLSACLDKLSSKLPDGKEIPAADVSFRNASFRFLKYLWDTQGSGAAIFAKKCPLIAANGSAIRWSVQRKPMAPVLMWHAAAQPFSELYEDDRILSDEYRTITGSPAIVNALAKWDMVFADPLSTDAPRDLRDERLRAILSDGQDGSDIIVSDIAFSQIALLPNQLVQRTQVSEEMAKLLLGLVLKHAAVNDRSWRQTKSIGARKDRTDVQINVHPALWLSDLKTKAWVPVRGEKDGAEIVQPVIADAGNLRGLLDSAWLVKNDAAVELLSRYFGFSALELRLLSTVSSEADRSQVEAGLAKIVQVLGGDPAKYNELVVDLAEQQKREADKDRNRQFGLGVQHSIESALEKRGVHLKLIDCGYDYDLFLKDAPSSLDAGTHHFAMGDYLLEIKATTTGEVRLTPAQVQKATELPDRFVLCVVDLRGTTKDQMEQDWSGTAVEHRARIVLDIGTTAGETHDLVTQARDCEVAIRNDSALRYGVPVSVWQAGSPLVDWISKLSLSSTISAGA